MEYNSYYDEYKEKVANLEDKEAINFLINELATLNCDYDFALKNSLDTASYLHKNINNIYNTLTICSVPTIIDYITSYVGSKFSKDNRIEYIKSYRQITGCSLNQAIDFIDSQFKLEV